MARASHNTLLLTVYDAFGSDLLNPHIDGFASAEIRDAVVKAVGRVEDAIVAGDAEAAHRRMVRHVVAYRASLERAAPRTVVLGDPNAASKPARAGRAAAGKAPAKSSSGAKPPVAR
jgi:hypothetical protein